MKYSDSLIQMVGIVYPSHAPLKSMALLGDDRLPEHLMTSSTISVDITEPFTLDSYEYLKERVIIQRRKHAIYIQAIDERRQYRLNHSLIKI